MSYRPIHQVSRPCTFCHTPFTPRRRDAKYCSSSCCTQAHYARKGRPDTRPKVNPPDAPEQPQQKEVGFGKLMGAAAAANVLAGVAGTLLDIGTAARITKLEHQLEQANQKLDHLLKQNAPDPFGGMTLASLFGPKSPQKLPLPVILKK